MVLFCVRWRVRDRQSIRGRLCFPCTMQGGIDTGTHDKHLIGHAKETNKLWQNLVRAMDEGFEATLIAGIPRATHQRPDQGSALAPRSSSMRSPREPISLTSPVKRQKSRYDLCYHSSRRELEW